MLTRILPQPQFWLGRRQADKPQFWLVRLRRQAPVLASQAAQTGPRQEQPRAAPRLTRQGADERTWGEYCREGMAPQISEVGTTNSGGMPVVAQMPRR